MNKKMVFLLLLIFLLVCNPKTALSGAINGLNLWFNVIVPTLLPFMIISQLMQNVYGSSIKNPVLYVLCIGFLCGYPMGAFAACSMYQKERIDKKTAYRLLTCCNISSPAFVISYISMTSLKFTTFPYEILLATYIPAALIALFTLMTQKKVDTVVVKADTPLSFDVLDAAVTGSIANVLKLGVYMIIFAIIAAFITIIPLKNPFLKCILAGTAEITTGIDYTVHAGLNKNILIPLVLMMNAFGGLSCAMQSMTFLNESGLSIKKYMCKKILLAILTGITWFLLTHVL